MNTKKRMIFDVCIVILIGTGILLVSQTGDDANNSARHAEQQLFHSHEPPPVPHVTPPGRNAALVDEHGFRSYQNNEHGFQIDYPATWWIYDGIDDQFNEEKQKMQFSAPDRQHLEISARWHGLESIRILVNQTENRINYYLHQKWKDDWKRYAILEPTIEPTIEHSSFLGFDAIVIHDAVVSVIDHGIPVLGRAIFIPTKGMVIEVNERYAAREVSVEPVVGQILSTLRFIGD